MIYTKKRIFWILLAIFASITANAAAFGISGTVYDASTDSPAFGATVSLLYKNTTGVNMQSSTGTDSGGHYAFQISDYMPLTPYTINFSKGNLYGPEVRGTIAGDETKINYVSISAVPVAIRSAPAVPIINKNDTVLINVTVEPLGNNITGMQAYYNLTNARLSFNSASEVNLFNRGITSAWGNQTSQGILQTFSLIIVPGAKVNANGTYGSFNMTGTNNGTANFTLRQIMLSSINNSWVRNTLYTARIIITQSWDLNGDYVDNIKDLAIWNSYNSTGICPALAYNRCSGTSKAEIMANYGKSVNTTLPS